MPESTTTAVTMVGLGAMGTALTRTLLTVGHSTTVWNRSATKVEPLVADGARPAATIGEAVSASPFIVTCLYDHDSVLETLEPVVRDLRGRSLVNLTTTAPGQAREFASWAAANGITYLDGAIMATPPMIGSREAAILYSGSREVFDSRRDILDAWATSMYDGDDPGMASLFDLALLSGMYAMIAGFLHGAALVNASGVKAAEFARRSTPFLSAMAESLPRIAAVVDAGKYDSAVQSLAWTRPVVDLIGRTSEEQGVDEGHVTVLRDLFQRQIDAGYGAHDVARIYESLRGSHREEAR